MRKIALPQVKQKTSETTTIGTLVSWHASVTGTVMTVTAMTATVAVVMVAAMAGTHLGGGLLPESRRGAHDLALLPRLGHCALCGALHVPRPPQISLQRLSARRTERWPVLVGRRGGATGGDRGLSSGRTNTRPWSGGHRGRGGGRYSSPSNAR